MELHLEEQGAKCTHDNSSNRHKSNWFSKRLSWIQFWNIDDGSLQIALRERLSQSGKARQSNSETNSTGLGKQRIYRSNHVVDQKDRGFPQFLWHVLPLPTRHSQWETHRPGEKDGIHRSQNRQARDLALVDSCVRECGAKSFCRGMKWRTSRRRRRLWSTVMLRKMVHFRWMDRKKAGEGNQSALMYGREGGVE